MHNETDIVYDDVHDDDGDNDDEDYNVDTFTLPEYWKVVASSINDCNDLTSLDNTGWTHGTDG
jgi:hypothetical protein